MVRIDVAHAPARSATFVEHAARDAGSPEPHAASPAARMAADQSLVMVISFLAFIDQ